MSHTKPKISVILPVYNGQDYLAEAIDSVLSQSFSDFELIVINDGSSDGSAAIIEKWDDPRVRFYQQSNKGLAATLNRMILLAKGLYIARQDQDDVSLPSRFERQVAFLDANPDVGMVGTSAEIWVGNERTNRFLRHPTDDAALKFGLLFDNHFVHSSVMIRQSVFERIGGYSEDFSRQPPEDYELWSRVMKKYMLANLPDVLLAYREIEGSMSRTGVNPFLPNLIKISAENIAWASGLTVDTKEVIALSRLFRGVYDQIPCGISFSEMQAILNQAYRKIAEDAGVSPRLLENTFRELIHKLRYHYFDYRCGGRIGKMMNSDTGRYVKNIAKRILR
jgi:glycosyltransferase involved in cell wall biosynthesis